LGRTESSPSCAGPRLGERAASPPRAGFPTTNVYDFVDGKISRTRIFFDRQEALEAVGLRG
jgi:hypothetical protein